MRQSFRVIEGGLSDGRPAETQAGSLAEAASEAPPAWRIDLRRPSTVGPGEIGAWRALLTRIRAADPVHADPDYLLTAAQHQAGGRDLVFAFAWDEGGGRERLHGVVPLALPHGLWGNGRVQVWHPPGVAVLASIEAAHSDAVAAELRVALRRVRPGASLRLDPVPVGSSVFERAVAPVRAIATRPAIPARNLVAVRPYGSHQNEVSRIAEPHRIRDAVEEYLTFDARVSPVPIIADPSEAAMVRVVTRLFGKRRQACVEFTRRDGRLVEAALRLGSGPVAIVWRQAAGEVGDREAGDVEARVTRPA